MSSVKWSMPRSKSAFDISTVDIDDFVPPGVVPGKREQLLLPHEEKFHNTMRRASEVPTGKPPMPQHQGGHRKSLIEKAFNGTLKNELKNLWARRSSLSLFKSRSSPVPSDEESLNSSQESIDDLMKEMGGFFVVDRSAWASLAQLPQPTTSQQPSTSAPKRRSFSLFSRNKN